MKRNPVVGLVAGCALILALSGATKINDAMGQQPKAKKSSSGKATALSLDVIIGGPFALIESKNCPSGAATCLLVVSPDVASHTGMIGLGGGGDIKQFVANGAYDFTRGVRPSTNTALGQPVLGATILNASASSGHLPPTPASPFATIELPMPREIVPWNAEPMQISSTTPVPPSTTQQVLATLVILRYDFQDSDQLQMNDAGGAFWKPVPEKAGNERVLLIGIIPQDPTASEDPHVHAGEAFNALVKMVGLTWFVQFVDPPPAGFQRNQPPNPASPLPNDLQSILNPTTAQSGDMKTSSTGMKTWPFGRINDCKAPALLVIP